MCVPTRALLASVTVAFLSLFWVNAAKAVPHFTRMYEKSCSYCHLAFPQLNSKGRKFKESGYRMDTDQRPENVADILTKGTFPISAVIKARIYDKRDSGDDKIRAIHEVEVIFAGAIGDRWSAFVEIEAEDENDFEPEISPAVLNYNHNRALNLQLSYSDYFFADPYGFLGDGFRLTRSHVKTIDERFGGADGNGRLRDTRQAVSLWGRPAERVFYILGYGGLAGDAEGENPKNAFGRLAVDVTKDVMIGAYGINGEDESTSQNFSRYGLDFQGDFGPGRVQAMYLKAEDDRAAAAGEDKNDAFSVQGMWVFKSGRKPTFVPLIRFDSYERNNGAESYDELVLNLSYYFTENIRGYIEYWDQLSVPNGRTEDNRITLQIDAAW